MTSSKILAALALFSATASAPVFSATLHRQARHNYVSSRVNRAGVANHSWCSKILRTRSIVLMPIEANVPKQQEEGAANVSSTLFSNCMRGAAGPPVRAENLKRTVLVEFTVHTGDEILRDDEWAGDWTAAEASAG